ncbi:hypothetical protein [Tardiphaga sp. 862_B3_N1_1]|uniref:hypothetical protein n=1 Tax=Tardiphaga sp. 862_B3_N1_1 TaxID=3240763 RepID=UPI003F8A8797
MSPHLPAIAAPTDQLLKSMALLLAYADVDLGDEREVMRRLQTAGNDMADIVLLADGATEMARVIRANSRKLEVS